MFAIQPWSQPVGMFGAGAAEAGRVVQDHAAGLAVPRLIERDREKFTGPRGDLKPIRVSSTPHSSIILRACRPPNY